MCNFVSFLEDEKHNYHYFTHAQRLSKVTFKDCTIPRYDSHASIAEFYGVREDDCNKYEYNPFTDILILDQQNMEENEEEVIAFVHSINWRDFCEDIEGARKFLDSAKDMPFMQNSPNFDLSGCKVFDTKEDAQDAVWDSGGNAARYAALFAAFNAANGYAYNAARNAARDATYDAIRHITRGFGYGAVPFAAGDIVLYCVIHYLCADLPIPQKHIDHINKRYSIWANGYGVLGDIDGVFYVYRHL